MITLPRRQIGCHATGLQTCQKNVIAAKTANVNAVVPKGKNVLVAKNANAIADVKNKSLTKQKLPIGSFLLVYVGVLRIAQSYDWASGRMT